MTVKFVTWAVVVDYTLWCKVKFHLQIKRSNCIVHSVYNACEHDLGQRAATKFSAQISNMIFFLFIWSNICASVAIEKKCLLDMHFIIAINIASHAQTSLPGGAGSGSPTSSPGEKWVTSDPQSSTTPDTSRPRMRGNSSPLPTTDMGDFLNFSSLAP